jgi:hypothetical protein
MGPSRKPGWAQIFGGAAWLHGVEAMVVEVLEMELLKMLGTLGISAAGVSSAFECFGGCGASFNCNEQSLSDIASKLLEALHFF